MFVGDKMAGMAAEWHTSIAAVAALHDELRRGLYTFIRRARSPVTREEAAAAVGISRKLAGFHLDKLVETGLLTARYAPLGRRHKLGRTPKAYEPSDADIRISIPQRQHDTLADILLDAVLAEGDTETARDAALRIADERGRALGAAERTKARPGRLGAERALTLAAELLHRHGFEPAQQTPQCLRLHNCPFHPLAAKAPEVICAINHAFLTGVLTGLRAPSVEAVLAPHTGECCVELRSAHPANATER
jgi:predicted ArsR family transcriptional regulator